MIVRVSVACFFLVAATAGARAQVEEPARAPPADGPPPTVTQPNTAKPSAPSAESKSAAPAPATPQVGGKALLPWTKAPVAATPFGPATPAAPPTTAKEMFALFGLEESRLTSFFSGQPISIDEEELLAKILFRLPRFGLANIDRWRRKNLTLDDLASSPDVQRTQVVALRGRVTRLEKKPLTPELAQALEYPHFYLATLTLPDAAYAATIAVKDVPAAWLGQEQLSEPAACDGMFFKLVDPTADPPELLFAATHLQWFPEKEYPEAKVGPDQVRLAALGLDVSLLDEVRRGNRRTLLDSDREAFYQLLSLLQRAPPGQTRPAAGTKVDVASFLVHPDEWVGRLVHVSAAAKRITKVPVLEPDVQQRFGITQYYQIDMLLPLDKNGITIKTDKSGENDIQYRNDFPATLNVLDLPAGIEPGENVNLLIEADAVYFKTWSYHSAFTDRYDRRQLAPLFVGRQPAMVKIDPPQRWLSDVLVFAALGVSVAIIGFVVLAFRRRGEPAAAIAPNFSGLADAPVKPDFSQLTESSAQPTAAPQSAAPTSDPNP